MLVHLIAAFVAGVITLLGFAPFDIWPLAIVGPAVLFYLWRNASPRLAFFSGWVYGVGLMGFGVFWLRISINQFGGLNLPIAAAIALGFAALIALLYGLAAWFATRLVTRADDLHLILIFPAVFVLSEWLRGWLLTGFPWLTLGYSQIDSPLSVVAPLLGVYGVSWLVALSAAAIVAWRARWPLAVVGCLWLGAATVGDVGWTKPQGEPIRASIIQGNIPQEEKWRSDQLAPTLVLYRDLTERASNSRLIIWPETAVPAFADQVEDFLLRPLQRRLEASGQDLLMGIPIREPDGRYYNAILNIGVSGRSAYFKRHLVPFGEFMPLRRWLEPLVRLFAIPMSNFAVGSTNRPLLKSAGYWVGMSICYEDAFGEESIRAMPDAGFLVNVSNDAWFGDSLAPHQHLQIARMRAAESQRYLLRATNTGVSAIIDANGRVLATAPQFQQAVLTGMAQPRSGATPYVKFGDATVLVLVSIALFSGLVMVRRTAK